MTAPRAATVPDLEDARTIGGHPAAPLWLGGCSFGPWMRLLAQRRFRMSLRCVPMAVLAMFGSACQAACLGPLQALLYRRRVARTVVRQAPIFILGHWRSGTTLLHELISLDPRNASPTTYACGLPAHFVLTEKLMQRVLRLLPSFRRPMDDMPLSFASPQEDEYALLMMGQPSPYWNLVFPDHRLEDPEFYDLDAMSAEAREDWKGTMRAFVQRLTFVHGGACRLVLKSPSHTLRIGTLLELFPDARFVEIVRNPYEVFPSTLRMYEALVSKAAWQRVTIGRLKEDIFRRGELLHERLEKGSRLIRAARFHRLRYEDLVRDPEGEVRALYARLELDGFENWRPALARYVEARAGYRTNRHVMTARTREQITRRWGHIADRHGYAPPPDYSDAARGGGVSCLIPSGVNSASV